MPPSIRYGKVFWETYNFLQESQWWRREKLEDYQMQQLSKLLHHAYENVPYYRKVFDERGLRAENIQSFDDLEKLPYLTKEIFKQHYSELISKSVKLDDLPMSHTSGTTGKPLQFYENSDTYQKEAAFIYHQWSRVGVKPGDPLIQLRGDIINSSKLFHYDPINNILRLSPRIDSEDIVCYYLEKIRKFRASHLHGYPSAIAVLASIIKQRGLHVPFKLKAVLFASESIYPWERAIVQEVFNCRVFSHYGMAEKVALAGECENAHHYHCLPQYGITEIDTDTNEIIGTSFLNYVNPFIRYRTTDIASQPIYSGCSECGREYSPVFSSVEGRLEDFIITPRGALIAPAVITHPFKDLKTIKDSQVIQKNLDRILVRAVPWEESDLESLKAELTQLCYGLHEIIGNVQIDAEVVEEIERSKSGKFKWIRSEVSRDSLEKGIRKV